MAMRWKGAAVALYTLCLGSLLLFSRSGTETALGVALIVIASAAVVTAVTYRSADGVRRDGHNRGTRRE
ncbi:hypothetical protein [Halopelagius longus]|uniref:Uncharacterized protein n=1 Tax=Halopelagius longus TaxID=1236180 RepID=A0A1H1ESR2_9EURY|nr:hypothetical protein [Halopelagius longus]RDI71876.1 hypothetical protein DWB78_09150 [Halopelagius longus]SDQ91795.1 hypothetical protein SAMN05216278_3048 [Halopelagius longus]